MAINLPMSTRKMESLGATKKLRAMGVATGDLTQLGKAPGKVALELRAKKISRGHSVWKGRRDVQAAGTGGQKRLLELQVGLTSHCIDDCVAPTPGPVGLQYRAGLAAGKAAHYAEVGDGAGLRLRRPVSFTLQRGRRQVCVSLAVWVAGTRSDVLLELMGSSQ